MVASLSVLGLCAIHRSWEGSPTIPRICHLVAIVTHVLFLPVGVIGMIVKLDDYLEWVGWL